VVDFIPPKKKVGICENGKITYKLESEVKKGYKLACNGELGIYWSKQSTFTTSGSKYSMWILKNSFPHMYCDHYKVSDRDS
jgi:hypothetical protein